MSVVKQEIVDGMRAYSVAQGAYLHAHYVYWWVSAVRELPFDTLVLP